ncbi:MAG: hypothetical protein Q9220_000019 [cf. Caloplaca sp. 1 TL-2023]
MDSQRQYLNTHPAELNVSSIFVLEAIKTTITASTPKVSVMTKGTVLITTPTEFTAFRTLVLVLQAGYSVLAAVHSKDESDRILSAPSIKRLKPGPTLSFVTVPDMTADHALAEAVKGDVQYIIHAASIPLGHNIRPDHFESQIISPTLKSVDNVLAAAHSNSHIKRVILTSSEMALIGYSQVYNIESFAIFTDAMPVPSTTPPYKEALEALAAAQSHALLATSAFLTKNKAQFTVVSLLPSITIGHNELARSTKELLQGSNLQAFQHLQGVKSSKLPNTTVLVDDVAKAHVLSLDTQKVEKSQRLFLSSGGVQGTAWYRAKEIVKEHYMEDVKKGWLSLDGDQPVNVVKVDSSRAEKELGISFAGFEKQMRDLLDQWVELKIKEEHGSK